MTKVWPTQCGLAYLVSVIDCCTREIVGLGSESACRTEEALAAAQPRRVGGFAFRFSWNGFDFDDGQRTQFTSARYIEL